MGFATDQRSSLRSTSLEVHPGASLPKGPLALDIGPILARQRPGKERGGCTHRGKMTHRLFGDLGAGARALEG